MQLEELLRDISPRRRQPGDPLFYEGDKLCGDFAVQGVVELDDEELCHQEYKPFSCEVPGCKHLSRTLLESEQHYSTRHRFECMECHKHLATPHLLDLHLCEAHDSFFALQSEKKPLFSCFVEECEIKFWNRKERMDHCVEVHKFPLDFRYDETRKKSTGRSTLKSKKKITSAQSMDTAETESAQKPVNITVNKRGRGRGGQICLGSGRRGKKSPLNWYQYNTPQNKAPTEKDTNIDMKELEEMLP